MKKLLLLPFIPFVMGFQVYSLTAEKSPFAPQKMEEAPEDAKLPQSKVRTERAPAKAPKTNLSAPVGVPIGPGVDPGPGTVPAKPYGLR